MKATAKNAGAAENIRALRRQLMARPMSMLDDDLYKFSMANAVMLLYPNVRVKYRFTDRRAAGKWTKRALEELQRRINAMANIALTKEEREYCERTLPWINAAFWEYLWNYRFDPSEVKIWLDSKKNLQIEIEGLWRRTIFWEVRLLYTVCEVFYEMIDTNWTEDGQVEKMEGKAQRLADAGVAWGDFGTRRRRHFAAQERVVEIGKKYPNFTGTSNVYLAMKHGVKALGTMAHEWVMGHSALFSLQHANRYALQAWNGVYQGNLGTALPDTFGTDAFLADFDGVLARLYDSVRHDSNDPFKWTDKMEAHYNKLAIANWKASKPLGYTDGNTDRTAIAIHIYVTGKGMRCWFGIGTAFVNDYGDESPALAIVIKLSEVVDTNGKRHHVVKLSDSPEKATGDADAIRVAKYVHMGIPLDAEPSAPTIKSH